MTRTNVLCCAAAALLLAAPPTRAAEHAPARPDRSTAAADERDELKAQIERLERQLEQARARGSQRQIARIERALDRAREELSRLEPPPRPLLPPAPPPRRRAEAPERDLERALRERGNEGLERVLEGLEELAARARDGGNRELAERLEQRIQAFRERTEELRRQLDPAPEPRPDRRARPAPAPRRSEPRAEGEEGTEYYFGYQGLFGRRELGYTPETRVLRLKIETENGQLRELRYGLGDGLEGLFELGRELFDQGRRQEEREPQERRERRRPGIGLDLF